MPSPKKSATPALPTRRSLATFKAKHDLATVVPNKIKTALERMKAQQGPEAYAYEATDPEGGVPFMKLADVGGIHLAQFRKQFIGHIVVVGQDTGSKRAPRRVWFATVAAATKARGGPAKPEDLE